MIEKIVRNILTTGFMGTFYGGVGFIYGECAHLPANSVAKAWFVWSVVVDSLMNIATCFSSNREHQKWIKKAVHFLSTGVAIHELRKRKLMGDKMMYFLVAWQIWDVVHGILFTADEIEKAKQQFWYDHTIP